MEAAFFDLDKTVIDRASIMAFAGHFRREGLLNRRAMAKGACTQLLYRRLGADEQRLEKVRSSVLAITKGWERDRVRRIVSDALEEAVDPITYVEARELIEHHVGSGRRVYLVSAAPAEIVEPIAERLGVHEAVASVARVDAAGCYTGELERYAYGPAKADAVRSIADRDGIDLERSFAYSDSATDVPMLEAVGHPVAVNPDHALRGVAEERGWEIAKFTELAHSRRTLWTWGPAAAAVAAAGGGATALAWRSHRSQLREA
jgi:HAD superfamily hydrolase (TIGR01490 family)